MKIQYSYTTKEEMKRVENKLFEIIMEEAPKKMLIYTIKIPFTIFVLWTIFELFFSIETIPGVIPGIAEYALIPVKENAIKVISKIVHQHFTGPGASVIITLPQLFIIGFFGWFLLKLSAEVLKVTYKIAKTILKEWKRSKFTEAWELRREINDLIHLKEVEETFSSKYHPDEKAEHIQHEIEISLPEEVIKQMKEEHVADFSFIDVKWQQLKRTYSQNFT